MPARITHFGKRFVLGALDLLLMMKPLIPSAASSAIAACYIIGAAAAVAAETPRQAYDIARGDATVTLKLFAAGSDRQVVYLVDTVRGVVTNPVQGTFTAREVIDRMLAATDLIVMEDPKTGAYLVIREPHPISPAPPVIENQPPPKSPSNLMKQKFPISILSGLLALVLSPADLRSAASPDEPIALSAFTVSSSSDVGYQVGESTAGGRVRASTFESTQPVTVVTRNFIDDVGTGQILDALKYVSGVTQSSQAVGADRMTIRGFQVSNTGLIDGFQAGGLNHQDAALFDRFEVVKGPNAIISPAGAPGGTVNLVTKSAQFSRNATAIELEAGRYDSNRASLDVNRAVTKDVAVRVVVSGQRDDGYYRNYEHNLAMLGALAWKFGSSSNLAVKYIFQQTRDQNFVGLPIDPQADTSTATPNIFPGLARNANIFNSDDIRSSSIQTFEGLYTVRIAEGLSTRVAGQYNYENSWFNQFDTGLTGPAQGDYDPLTGAYVYGVLFSKTPPYGVSGPAATPTAIYQRTTSGPQQGTNHNYRTAFQNDWVYERKVQGVLSQTSGGYAFNGEHHPHDASLFLIRSSANPATGLDTFNVLTGPYFAPIAGTITGKGFRSNSSSSTTTKQFYGNEVLKLFKDRLILNAGLSQSWFKFHLIDQVSPARTYDASVKGALQKSYGAVVEPLANMAVYYGHSEVTTFNSAGLPPAPQTQDSKSDEVGVRGKFLEGRAIVTVDYFTSTQNNFSVPNPANLDPSRIGLPPLPGLFTDRKAHGWELEANASITKELSVVGNYTSFKNRDTHGVVFRGTAEKSGALWVKYDFKENALKGFGVGAGLNYLARRPGDAPRSGFTAASTLSNPIYFQPTFWIPARTLFDLVLSYRINPHWNTRVIVNNLLNKKYIDSALNRQGLELGGDTNIRGQVTYKF
jgi:iron complex outermembrane receptor protein